MLYDFQKKTIDFIANNERVLCANQMGTGKTLCAIKTFANRKVLVVVPTSLKLNWYYEILKWGDCKYKIFINDLTAKMTKQLGLHAINDCDIAIISYMSLKKYGKYIKMFDYIVCDEAHIIKNVRAGVTKFILPYIMNANKVLFLTGTPIKNKIEDLFVFYKACFNTKMKYWEFCNKYANYVEKFFGTLKIRSFEGLKNEEELNRHMRYFYIRFENQDIELPQLVRLESHDFASVADAKIIKEMLADIELQTVLTERDIFALANHTTLRKAISIAKTNISIKKIEEIRGNSENKEQIIFFSCFKNVCERVAEYCAKNNITYGVITGDITTENRNKIVKEFQNGEIDIIIGTIGALSVGFTLTNANHMIINDLSYVPSDNLQAEKRHHRIGANKTKYVHIINITVPNCRQIDTEINSILIEKMKIIDKVIK